MVPIKVPKLERYNLFNVWFSRKISLIFWKFLELRQPVWNILAFRIIYLCLKNYESISDTNEYLKNGLSISSSLIFFPKPSLLTNIYPIPPIILSFNFLYNLTFSVRCSSKLLSVLSDASKFGLETCISGDVTCICTLIDRNTIIKKTMLHPYQM